MGLVLARVSGKTGLDLSEDEQALFDRIDHHNLPKHIAIIMDGNGRWAKKRNRPRIKGHKAAIPSVQHTVEGCVDLGISCLTVYAFSTENWKRPEQETGTLMALLRQYFRMETKIIEKHRIKVRVIGAVEDLSPGIQRDIRQIESMSRDNDGMQFNVAVNYSGKEDIITACQRALAAGVSPDQLDSETIDSYISTAGQPDPDLLIRTSGEMRISNFLLWQIAYSEIWATPTLWPDFRRSELYRGIIEYQSRHRRFGGL